MTSLDVLTPFILIPNPVELAFVVELAVLDTFCCDLISLKLLKERKMARIICFIWSETGEVRDERDGEEDREEGGCGDMNNRWGGVKCNLQNKFKKLYLKSLL